MTCVCFLALAAFAGGCLPIPQPGPAPAAGPTPPPSFHAARADSAGPATTRQDPVSREPRVRPWPMVFGPVEATPVPGPSAGQEGDSLVRAAASLRADSLAAAGTDSLAAPAAPVLRPSPPEVSVDLPPSARFRMEREARRDIALADSLARRSALRPLPDKQRDKLETALGLIKQAQDALSRGDIPGASNLAYKARLIAEEVSSRR